MSEKKTKGAALTDPATIKKARAQRAAKQKERGGVGYGALVNWAIAKQLSVRGKAITPATIARLMPGTGKAKHIYRMRTLTDSGYLLNPERGVYLLGKVPNIDALRPRDKRLVDEAVRLIDGGDDADVIRPAPIPAQLMRAVQQAAKALAPFARYGARLSAERGANLDAAPLLLRSDGVKNADFVDAHEASEALAAALDGGEREASETEATGGADLSRFL